MKKPVTPNIKTLNQTIARETIINTENEIVGVDEGESKFDSVDGYEEEVGKDEEARLVWNEGEEVVEVDGASCEDEPQDENVSYPNITDDDRLRTPAIVDSKSEITTPSICRRRQEVLENGEGHVFDGGRDGEAEEDNEESGVDEDREVDRKDEVVSKNLTASKVDDASKFDDEYSDIQNRDLKY